MIKRITGLVFVFLLLASFSFATVEDDFTRASSSTLGTATNGNVWVESLVTGDWEILGNKMYGEVTGSGNNNFATLELSTAQPTSISFNSTWGDTCSGTEKTYTSFSPTGALTPAALYIIWCRSGQAQFYDGGWQNFDSAFTHQAGVEYSIELLNCEYTTYTCEIWINGVQYESSAGFWNHIDMGYIIHNNFFAGMTWEMECLTTDGSTCAPPDLTTNLELYYSFDNADLTGSNPDDLTINGNDGTTNGATTGGTGILNQAFDYDGVTDYVTGVDIAYDPNEWTYNMWYYLEGASIESNPFMLTHRSTNELSILCSGGAARPLRWVIQGSSSSFDRATATLCETDGWHMATMTRSGDNFKFYKDGLLIDSITQAVGTLDPVNPFQLGIWYLLIAGEWDGKIDEFGMWNGRTLSSSEINLLYGGGSSCPHSLFATGCVAGSSSPPFQIIATSINGTPILTFNATITGDSFYSTTNGTIITNLLQNSTFLWNITTEAETYFSATYSSYNISSNLNASLFQAQVTPQAFEILTNNTLTGGNFTIGSTTLNNGGIFNLSAGIYNITYNKTGYYSKTQQFNITPLFNGTLNITGVYNSLLNITANDQNDNSNINSFYASFNNNTYNTTNGFIEIGYLNGTNITLSVWGDTYVLEEYNITFNQSLIEYNALLWETGAIKVYLFSESTGLPINGTDINILNIDGSADIDGNFNSSSFYTTINESGNLTITLSGGGYSQRVYYEVMADGRYLVFNAYMLLDANSQLTTFQVYNDLNQLVGDAQLSFYKTINNTLQRVVMAKTDFSGSVQANLDNNALYLLRVTHDDYLQKEISFIPTSTSYQVYLTGTALSYTSLFDSIDYYLEPSGSRSLEGNTSYNYLLSISDSSNSLEYWGVNISFINDSGMVESYLSNMTISTGGATTITSITPINNTVVNATFFFKKLGEDYFEIKNNYYVYSQLTASYTLEQSFEDYGDEISDLSKVLISVFITMAIVGITASLFTFNSTLLGIEVLIILGFFTYLGWVQLWLYLLLLTPSIILTFLTRGGQD